MIPRIRIIMFAIILAVITASAASACPTCKQGLNEHGGNLIRGYFWSIIFMMSMPFLILGGLSTMFYFDVRRARRRQSELAEAIMSLGSAG